MTNHWIEVDGEVIDAIKNAAEPFVDNQNRVLRRLLDLPAVDVPILLAITEGGGSAPRSTVMIAVEMALEDRLTDLDRTPMSSGGMRWRARVDQARNELVKRGLLESSLPGIWTLTEAGTEYLDRRLKSKAAAERRGAPA